MGKASALEKAMQERDGTGPQEQDPGVWERVKRLFSTGGAEWQDNANAMLPEALSARQAVLRKRAQQKMMDDMNKSE